MENNNEVEIVFDFISDKGEGVKDEGGREGGK